MFLLRTRKKYTLYTTLLVKKKCYFYDMTRYHIYGYVAYVCELLLWYTIRSWYSIRVVWYILRIYYVYIISLTHILYKFLLHTSIYNIISLVIFSSYQFYYVNLVYHIFETISYQFVTNNHQYCLLHLPQQQHYFHYCFFP